MRPPSFELPLSLDAALHLSADGADCADREGEIPISDSGRGLTLWVLDQLDPSLRSSASSANKSGAHTKVPESFDRENGYREDEQPGELYNLRNDLDQKRNLYASEPARVKEHTALPGSIRAKGQVRSWEEGASGALSVSRRDAEAQGRRIVAAVAIGVVDLRRSLRVKPRGCEVECWVLTA